MPPSNQPSIQTTPPAQSRIPTDPVEPKVFVGRISVQQNKPRKRSDILGVKVVGVGASAGSNLVRNEDLASRGYDSDWILQRTGIKARYQVAEGEATSDMAIRAAKACLENANVAPTDVDLIIVATVTPDHLTPSTACLVQGELGCDASAMDLNAACSGFIYGLVTAGQFVRSGCARNALVIGAETASMLVNPEDRKTFPLFGDGAGAVLLTADENPDSETTSGLVSYRLASDGSMSSCLKTPAGGSRKPICQAVVDGGEQFLSMDGRTVFKWAVRLIPEAVDDVLTKANLKLEDIDLFIPHQANIRIIDAAVDVLGIEREKVFVNLDRYGNTSAASIPISISEAVAQGRIKRGDNVMMVGFGAGLTWGACIMRW